MKRKYTKIQQRDFKKYGLDNSQIKMYFAVKGAFPKTQHLTALDVAIQRGVKFQYIPFN